MLSAAPPKLTKMRRMLANALFLQELLLIAELSNDLSRENNSRCRIKIALTDATDLVIAVISGIAPAALATRKTHLSAKIHFRATGSEKTMQFQDKAQAIQIVSAFALQNALADIKVRATHVPPSEILNLLENYREHVYVTLRVRGGNDRPDFAAGCRLWDRIDIRVKKTNICVTTIPFTLLEKFVHNYDCIIDEEEREIAEVIEYEFRGRWPCASQRFASRKRWDLAYDSQLRREKLPPAFVHRTRGSREL